MATTGFRSKEASRFLDRKHRKAATCDGSGGFPFFLFFFLWFQTGEPPALPPVTFYRVNSFALKLASTGKHQTALCRALKSSSPELLSPSFRGLQPWLLAAGSGFGVPPSPLPPSTSLPQVHQVPWRSVVIPDSPMSSLFRSSVGATWRPDSFRGGETESTRGFKRCVATTAANRGNF